MSAHTPGPWDVKACNGRVGEEPGLYVTYRDGGCDLPIMKGDFCQSEADARLIAAAPELLDVMRDVAALLPASARLHPRDLHALQTRVCAALAKAQS